MLSVSSGPDDSVRIVPLNNEAEYVVPLYSDMIYRIALTHTCSREDAEDVLQEVFLTYYRKNKEFNEEEHRKSWLIRVTLNCCDRTLAKRKKQQYVPIDALEIPVRFEYDSDKTVYRAVLSLPEKLRRVVELFYFEELSAKEIGKVLNLRESAVFMRLSRARAELKEKLKGEFEL